MSTTDNFYIKVSGVDVNRVVEVPLNVAKDDSAEIVEVLSREAPLQLWFDLIVRNFFEFVGFELILSYVACYVMVACDSFSKPRVILDTCPFAFQSRELQGCRVFPLLMYLNVIAS